MKLILRLIPRFFALIFLYPGPGSNRHDIAIIGV